MLHWLSSAFGAAGDAPAPSSSDRRRDARVAQQSRVVAICIGDRAVHMPLVNVSTRGALGEVSLPAAVGDGAIVRFENGLRVDAVVRSVGGPYIGLEFLACLPLDVVEGDMLDADRTRRRRFPRHASSDAVKLLVGDTLRIPARLTSLSAGGAGLIVDAALVPGQSVAILWPDDPPRHGQVRWTRGTAAGIAFAVPGAGALAEALAV